MTTPMTVSRQWKNKRIGILGGSFNPPHAGHVHISEIALKALNLDAIWWLVTPQNPLKSSDNTLSFDKRIELSKQLTKSNPNIIITDIERELNTNYSYDSIIKLKKIYPDTNFIWVAGMDCAQNFHYWHQWKEILSELPMLYINRDNNIDIAVIEQFPVRKLMHITHETLDKPKSPALDSKHIYWLITNETKDITSTELRKENKCKNIAKTINS